MRAQSAANHIRRTISQGQLLPGQKLNEVALANELGVSRNTLREAFSALAGEGIITAIPYRGVFIARPTPEDVRDLFLARVAVEPGAVRWGDFVDLKALERVVEGAEKERDSGRFHNLGNANQEFHRLLVSSVRSESLDAMMGSLLARMRLAFLTIGEIDTTFHIPYIDVNRSIVELLKQGDRQSAAEELATSLRDTGSRAARLLEKFDSGTPHRARGEWL